MGRSSLKVHRLALPFASLSGDRANVVMLAAAFALLAVGVLTIRRGPFGRLLGAMRDSPAACATLGLDLTRTKLAVFALATAIAAVGGALFGSSQQTVTSNNFQYIQSLFLLLIVTVWGINTVSGALLGGLALAVFPLIAVHLPTRFTVISYLGTGLGAISLGRNPNGVIGQLSAAWQDLKSKAGSSRARPAIPREEVRTVAAPAN
jgi:branched-chain amino acid transport system permease protein